MTAVLDPHDGVLGAHVAAGVTGLALGRLALRRGRPPSYRSRAGSAHQWAVLVVALTVIALVAFDDSAMWWLALLAALSYGLALVGYLAPARRDRAWIRAYAHGQGGSYIALVTALCRLARRPGRHCRRACPDAHRIAADRAAGRSHHPGNHYR